MRWGSNIVFAALGMQYRALEDCVGVVGDSALANVQSATPTPHVVMLAFRAVIEAGHEPCLRALASAFGEDGSLFEDVLFFGADFASRSNNTAYMGIVLGSYPTPSLSFLGRVASIAVEAAQNDAVPQIATALRYIRDANKVVYLRAVHRATTASVDAGSANAFSYLWRYISTSLRPVMATQMLPVAARVGSSAIVSTLLTYVNDLSPWLGAETIRLSVEAATEANHQEIVLLLNGPLPPPYIVPSACLIKDRTD